MNYWFLQLLPYIFRLSLATSTNSVSTAAKRLPSHAFQHGWQLRQQVFTVSNTVFSLYIHALCVCVQEFNVGCFPQSPSTYFLGQRFLPEPGVHYSARLFGLDSPVTPSSVLRTNPQHYNKYNAYNPQDYRHMPTYLVFTLYWGSNLGPRACAVIWTISPLSKHIS